MKTLTKKLNRKILKAVVLLLLGFSVSLYASFEDVEIGAKATSLGGAFVAQADDASGMFYNPAGLSTIKKAQIFASYEKMFWGLTDESNIGDQAFAFAIPLRFGSIGFAYHSLALKDLYTESDIKFGYSHIIKGGLSAGFNVSSLKVSYGEDKYTRINPVFDKGPSASKIGFDAGLLYVGQFINLGIAAMNLNEPDLGLKYENNVLRKINFGVRIKQRVLNLNVAGTYFEDNFRFKTGIETWLYKRTFAVRGGMNIGSHKYRNATLGMSFKNTWYSVDYSFNYPLSGITGIYGSHQLSFIVKFGKEKEEDLFTWKDLIQLTRVDQPDSRKSTDEKMEIKPEEIAKAQDLIITAKKDFEKGSYEIGLRKITEAKQILNDDTEIIEFSRKGRIVVRIVPEIKGSSKKNILIRKAVAAYMNGEGKTSLNNIRYAAQLYSTSQAVSKLLPVIEKEFSGLADAERVVAGFNLVEQKLQQSLALIYDKKYVRAISLCKEVIDLEPKNVLALMRMGSAYWAMGHTTKSKEVWKQALKYDPSNPQLIEFLTMDKKVTRTSKRVTKPAVKKTVDKNTKKEYDNGVNYYKRVKRYGANNSTLKSILMRMKDKFEGKNVDISFINGELKKY